MRTKTFEDFLNEIYLLTPPSKKKNSSKPKSKKPDDEDPEVIARRLRQKQQQESSDYLAGERARDVERENEKRKKARLARRREEADSARHIARTRGIPFSDAIGSGFIRNGTKHYS